MSALLIAALVLAMVPAMAESVKAKVSSSSAKIYRTASSSSDHVKMKKGTEVTVTAVKGDWAKVKVSGKTGYMPTKYLSKSSSSSGKKKSASRTAAYVNKATYVYKKASSSSGKKALSVNTKVYVVGTSGSYSKVENSSGSASGYIKSSCLSKSKVSTKKASSSSDTSWKSQVVKMDWFGEGKNVLKKGKYGYIYDVDTGIELRIKRMGGHNHADVEPATAADTAKLLRVAKGDFSWKSHAVILKAAGKYVACGINTEPHGDQTIQNNNYDGQFCLHMSGSITHGTEQENENHQKSIDRAYNWAHKND